LEGVTALSEEGSCVVEVLPVDPGALMVVDFVVDLLLDLSSQFFFQLQRFAVVLKSFVVVEVLLEGASCLHMDSLLRHRRILLVSTAFVVLTSVCLPVPKTHPAEVVLAFGALHVVAASILLDARVTVRTVFGMRADIVGGFAVVGTLDHPAFDSSAGGGRMIINAASKAERSRACFADGALRLQRLGSNHSGAVGTWAETQLRMAFHVVLEHEMLVFST